MPVTMMQQNPSCIQRCLKVRAAARATQGVLPTFQTKQKFILCATLLIRIHLRDPTYYFTPLVPPCYYKTSETLYEGPVNETMETTPSEYYDPKLYSRQRDQMIQAASKIRT